MKQVINPCRWSTAADRPMPPPEKPPMPPAKPKRSIGALRSAMACHNDIIHRIRAREEADTANRTDDA